MHRSAVLLTVAITLPLASLAGCGRSPSATGPAAKPTPPPNVRVLVAGWGGEQREQADLPGIDYASIVYYPWDDEIALAIWTDGINNPSTMVKSLPRLSGRFEFDNGCPDVKYDCITDDGKTGTVKVPGQAFDLANGWLILVSTSNAQAKVEQVAPEAFRRAQGPTQLETQMVHYFASLKDDSSIIEFFRDSKTVESPK